MDPPDPLALIETVADERLLTLELAGLPEAERRPVPPPPSRARARIVALGATLTGVTLVAGVVALALGAGEAIFGTGRGRDILAIAGGAILLSTHWGWVHVAEATANRLERGRGRELQARQRSWLDGLEPYTRWTVATSVLDDGSIRIARTRHTPALTGAGTFSFESQTDLEEVHASDESGALVAERAESLRRDAALATERERERYEAAAGAWESVMLDRDDEEHRREARRAASRALSERINSNLRDPPLIE